MTVNSLPSNFHRALKAFGLRTPDSLGPDHFVLNRIPLTDVFGNPEKHIAFPIALNEPVGDEREIAILDLETTGFNPEVDEAIEVGIIRASYSPSAGRLTSILGSLSALEQPARPLESIITEVTGLTDDILKGQTFPTSNVSEILSGIEFIVAHNAAFDKAFFENRFPQLRGLKWVCSCKGDIDWKSLGYPSSSLPKIASHQHFFYDAHRATIDCMAVIWVLFVEPKAFEQMLDNAQKESFKIQAFGAPFEVKDQLKANGFKWDGDARVWWALVKGLDKLNEVSEILSSLYPNGGHIAHVEQL
ncbi:exonuclease domain-containing protein [Aliidiomarina quisquiliarum]|uniref:exonuclease domain-containing protein n=1 Tax=Aliidiomarina quisquiliarum TaxID=2938947 RepID=UPI00208FAF3B|nr:exonuclease domain-containing protein [Aliidiomarina quisquiliarum]MCO4319970.1 exonuclease domain-containing protein [Aliidiomarina quisquiliarum]